MTIMAYITIGMLCLCGLKSIFGFHWPWEKCPCCGRKWSEIYKEQDEKMKQEIMKELDEL